MFPTRLATAERSRRSRVSGQLGGFALSLSAQVSGYNAGSQLQSNTTAAKKSMGSLRSESVSIILFLPTLSWSAGQIPCYGPMQSSYVRRNQILYIIEQCIFQALTSQYNCQKIAIYRLTLSTHSMITIPTHNL